MKEGMMGDMAKDPVCDMEVDEATAEWKSEYKGDIYYFCAPGCKKAFDVDPRRYIEALDHEGYEHHR